MASKFEFIVMSFLLITSGNVLSGLGSLLAVIYYLSMIKVNVVNKKYDSSWSLFIKSIFKLKK